MLSSLKQNTEATFCTLEDLLSWSKQEILDIEPDLQSLDIINVLEEVLSYFEQHIKIKQLVVKRSYGSAEAYVYTDRNMLKAILRNIISNAIKYNNKYGEIEIKVISSGNDIEIVIKDSGVGMGRESLDKLFEYDKMHSKGTQGESSVGFGLILAKEFIDKLDARLSVSSEAGKGSIFTIAIKANRI